MNTKSTCYGCDYFFDIAELESTFDHQLGEIKLCKECLERVGA